MNSRRVGHENQYKYGQHKQTRYYLRSTSNADNKAAARTSIPKNKSCVVPHKQKQLGRSEQRKPTHSKNNNKQTSNIEVEKASNPKNCASSSKNGIQKDSDSSQVWVEKKKTQPPASLTELPPELEEQFYEEEYYEDFGGEFDEPIYHITWDGFSKEYEQLEQICPLCENDLSYTESREYDNDYDDIQPSKLPDVAVLSCGHTFHSECLMSCTEEEQLSDPPCLICISFLD